jgi:hypothetical protein
MPFQYVDVAIFTNFNAALVIEVNTCEWGRGARLHRVTWRLFLENIHFVKRSDV